MKTYTANEVSNILGVHEEHVRRLIREGKMLASMQYRKAGYRITDYDLRYFVIRYPRYEHAYLDYFSDDLNSQIEYKLDQIDYRLEAKYIERDILDKEICCLEYEMKRLLEKT